MLLTIQHVSKAFGAHRILQDITFTVNPGERVGLVGANGSGKSTLLRILAGHLPADAGDVIMQTGLTLGYLPQQAPEAAPSASMDDLIFETSGELRTIEGRLRELEVRLGDAGDDFEGVLDEYGRLQERYEQRGGYDLDHRIDAVLDGLQLGHLGRERRFATLSGGEQARVMLAILLLSGPDLLLLDEPTNHLDFASIDWLGRYLSEYRGAVLLVSHDRRLLNSMATRIVEIDEHSHQGKIYVGDYDAYRAAKQRERAEWEAGYEAEQVELGELRRAMRVTAAGLTQKTPARRDADKALYNAMGERAQGTAGKTIRWMRERLRRIESDPTPKPPEQMRLKARFDVEELKSDEVIRAEGLSKAFGQTCVLDDVGFVLRRAQRVVIVGPNGAGKTTLLNILAGLGQADAGLVRVAPAVRMGVLDQHARSLDPAQTVLNAYRDGVTDYEHNIISDLLRHGLFTLDDLEKRVGELSAGQRRKLQVARLVVQQPNLLLLDEPTNHLSFDVLNEFETALREFPGPILAVSHDRWFIERFGGEVWELCGGRLVQHHAEAAQVLAELHESGRMPIRSAERLARSA